MSKIARISRRYASGLISGSPLEKNAYSVGVRLMAEKQYAILGTVARWRVKRVQAL